MAEKKSLAKEFSKGLIKENPVLRLVLGTCPTLAVSTSVESALGMGLAATVVLVCANIVISAMRKVIPSKVRIPAYIVIIAGFVTIVQMLIQAFLPALYDMLGVYLALITVNCIILGRAEMFAGKNSVGKAALDGVGMGIGFTLALLAMATVRELVTKILFKTDKNSLKQAEKSIEKLKSSLGGLGKTAKASGDSANGVMRNLISSGQQAGNTIQTAMNQARKSIEGVKQSALQTSSALNTVRGSASQVKVNPAQAGNRNPQPKQKSKMTGADIATAGATAMVAGTAPLSRMICSTARAVSTFWG